MTPERWARIRRVFEAVVAAQPEARREAVEQACGDDASLRNEVLALLAAGDAAGGAPGQGQFLEKPVHAFEDYRAEPGAPPRRIGPFEIHGELGVGGMGAVYRAHRVDDPTRTPIAVKVMRHGLAAGELRERFYKEEAILAALDHPGIARLLDAGVTDAGSPWLAMQLIDGLPLTTWAERRSVDAGARLTLFLQVLRTRSHTPTARRGGAPRPQARQHPGHPRRRGAAARLRHRQAAAGRRRGAGDVDGHPRRADDDRLREPGAGAGASVVDERSDVSALGVVVLYGELLTGRRPYRVTTRGRPEALLKAMLVDAPQPPSALVRADRPGDPRAEALADELAGDLDAIVTHALAKSADERCTSVAALAADLRHHLAGRIPAARTLPVTRRLAFCAAAQPGCRCASRGGGLGRREANGSRRAPARAQVDTTAAARAAGSRGARRPRRWTQSRRASRNTTSLPLDETTKAGSEHELDPRGAALRARRRPPGATPLGGRRGPASELGGPGAGMPAAARTLFAELSAADPPTLGSAPRPTRASGSPRSTRGARAGGGRHGARVGLGEAAQQRRAGGTGRPQPARRAGR